MPLQWRTRYLQREPALGHLISVNAVMSATGQPTERPALSRQLGGQKRKEGVGLLGLRARLVTNLVADKDVTGPRVHIFDHLAQTRQGCPLRTASRLRRSTRPSLPRPEIVARCQHWRVYVYNERGRCRSRMAGGAARFRFRGGWVIAVGAGGCRHCPRVRWRSAGLGRVSRFGASYNCNSCISQLRFAPSDLTLFLARPCVTSQK